MNDMHNRTFRTFDPAREEGAEPPQPRGNALRDRIRRTEAQPQGAVSRSGYVHQPTGPEVNAEPFAPIEADESLMPTPTPAPRLGEAPPRPSEVIAEPQTGVDPAPAAEPLPVSENVTLPIGVVLEIAGSGSMIAIDLQLSLIHI